MLFDHQIKLAKMLGYEDATYTLAVEQLMQRYYRTVMELKPSQRNAVAAVRRSHPDGPDRAAESFNERFQVKNGFLQTVDDEVFARMTRRRCSSCFSCCYNKIRNSRCQRLYGRA